MIRVLSREADRSMLGLKTVRIFVFQRVRQDAGYMLSSLLQGGSQGGNPAIVALEGPAEDQLLSHDGQTRVR